jgi:murein DD-endopeptidase MepM/ murein hydrolase activator NlpD
MNKNGIVLTISNINSSKSYNLSKFIQRFVIFGIGLFIIIFMMSFYFISYLDDEVTKLDKKHKNLQKLTIANEKLIIKKKAKIKELGGTLEDIENMMGINTEDNTNLINRATLAKITTAEKTYMLEVIPNGRPLKKITVVSRFGWRIHPITKKKRFHSGIDLRAKVNTDVFSTADGIVTYAQTRNRGSYGRMVIITHNFSFQTVYAHLKKVNVKIGDIIYKGTIVGKSGNSGRSTGPHLHYEVKYANKVLNPIDFVRWDLKNYKSIFEKQRRVKWESLIKMIKRQSTKIVQL